MNDSVRRDDDERPLQSDPVRELPDPHSPHESEPRQSNAGAEAASDEAPPPPAIDDEPVHNTVEADTAAHRAFGLAPNNAAPWSRKALIAIGLPLVASAAAVAALLAHYSGAGKKQNEATNTRVSDKPAAVSVTPRSLEPAPAARVASAPPGAGPSGSAPATGTPRVPALVVTDADNVPPIPVRRTGAGGPSSGGTRPMAPEDAPIMLVTSRPAGALQGGSPNRVPSAVLPSTPQGDDAPPDPMADTKRNLDAYQQQLQGLMDTLTRTTAAATGQAGGGVASSVAAIGAPGGVPPSGIPPGSAGGLPSSVASAGAGLFGGQLQGSATPSVMARQLPHRSLILPKGTAFTCALKTRVVSAASGLVGCMVQRNVYGDDGRVLLIERGSHMDGEYRISSVRPGMVRIPVLWTRIRTPLGVIVDIESPGTGALGESGIDGYVDNRWPERIGAAMLLSLIDDSVKLVIANQGNDRTGDTVVLPSTTANGSKLAEKVLDSTINIPPLIYQNQGGIVGIVVARDVDFSSVYELRATELRAADLAPAAPQER